MEFLFDFIIRPIYLILEFMFDYIYDSSNNIILTIFLMSFLVSLLCLPLYLRADKLKEEEKEKQKKLSSKVNLIKKNFKGDEKLLLLQTYYRQNNYHPIMGLRLTLSLLLQIPIFIAAYQFFAHLPLLDGLSCFLIDDLSKPDKIFNFEKFNLNVLPVLMTLINILAGFIYVKSWKLKENKGLIITSLVFLLLLYNSPSALVLYWLFNNVFSLLKNLCLNFCFIFKKINFNFKTNYKNSEYKKLYFLSMIALWLLLGLYIPTHVIATSPMEFMFEDSKPQDIIWHTSIVFAGIFLFWGSWIYYFSNKIIKKYLSYFALFTLAFFMANIFIFKLPNAYLLNTMVFVSQFEVFNSVPIKECLIYLLVFCVLFTFLFKAISKQKFYKLHTFLHLVIITSFIFSIYNYFQINTIMKYHLNNKPQSEKIDDTYINLSKTKKNVLIIFIDRAIGSLLPIIFHEHPQLSKQFNGFTYYFNTLSYAEFTILGYLPILGGHEYTPFELDKRKGVFEEKFNQALTMLPSIFSKNNWETTVINPIGNGWEIEAWGGLTIEEIETLAKNDLYEKHNINTTIIPYSIKENFDEDINIANSALTKRNMIYFSILLSTPANLRRHVYDNQSYHNPVQNAKNAYSDLFLKNYAELYYLPKLTKFSQNKNTFTVLNNALPHYPTFLTYPNYEISKYNDDKYLPPDFTDDISDWTIKLYHVNVATLKLLGKYFDYLKENNVYDNTRIIITADHGYNLRLHEELMGKNIQKNYLPLNPLIMVKDFNENKPFNMSFELMTNADVPYIALKNLFNNPINPYTGNKIINNSKQNIVLKTGRKWQPKHYLGKEKIFDIDDKVIYIKNAKHFLDGIITKIPYQEFIQH